MLNFFKVTRIFQIFLVTTFIFCLPILVSAATCGNGVIDSNEVCDGALLNDQSCSSQGFMAGSLTCASDCQGFYTVNCLDNCAKVSYRNNPNIYGTNPHIYILVNNQFRPFISYDVFEAYGYDDSELTMFMPDVINPIGKEITTVEDDLKQACPDLYPTQTTPTCTDTDDKNMYSQGKVFGFSKDIYGDYVPYNIYDECSRSGSQVYEMVCRDFSDGKTVDIINLDCPFGCFNGACLAGNNNTSTNPGVCGNNKIDAGEVCDGSLLNNQTCATRGFDSGLLSCSSDCKRFFTDSCLKTEKNSLIKCSDSLTNFSYLSGFSAGDTLNSIKNDDAKLKKMLNQVVTNKSLINDPGDPVHGLNEWVVPLTKDPLFGMCKWVEHHDTKYCYIYSYQSEGKVSAEVSPLCSDTEAQKLAMIKAIKEGYCCVKNDLVRNDPVLKLSRELSSQEKQVIATESQLSTKVDKNITKKLAGKVLLQVESKGEAWFVDAKTGNKFYMQDGNSAYEILKAFGMGIAEADLDKIPLGYDPRLVDGLADDDGDLLSNTLEEALGTDPKKKDTDGDGFDDTEELRAGYRLNGLGRYPLDAKLINRLGNGIVLQVQGSNARGQAWLIKDGYRYYIDPRTAYNAMRYLSLGVNNDNIRKIQTGGLQ